MTKEEPVSIDSPVKSEPAINVRLPWMDDDEDDERKKSQTARIIRPSQEIASASKSSKFQEEEEEMEQDSTQVIVIGLDETGQQPSEEQLTAIIQVCLVYARKTKTNSTY